MPMVPIVEETLGKVTNEQLFHACQALSRDDVPIAIDSGASHSLTPFIEDFVDHLEKSKLENLQGLNATADVKGEGWVEWMIQDHCGTKRMIRTRAHHVPTATMRLFSPQCHFQQEGSGDLRMNENKTIMQLPDEMELEFPYNHHSNLPLMFTTPTVPAAGSFHADLKTLGDPLALGGFCLLLTKRTRTSHEVKRIAFVACKMGTC